jgi:hypothetical protein
MATHNICVRLRTLVGATLLVSLMPAAAFSQEPGDAAALAVFTSRVDAYARLRGRLEEPLPPFDERRSSFSQLVARRYLASALRSARGGAQPGCLFGPPVEPVLRRRIIERIYAIDVEGLSGWDTETDVDLVIGEPLPAWAALPLPSSLSDVVPALPPAIEYRMSGGALVLWDARAQIVIDLLPQAFVEVSVPFGEADGRK